MENRIRPITTSPPIRKPPNACTTWPAAAGPSLPRDRISRVVATFSDSRSNVVSSNRVGKLVKSSGLCRNNATISTSTEPVMDVARPRSRISVGSGRISTDSNATTPTASHTSVPGARRRNLPAKPVGGTGTLSDIAHQTCRPTSGTAMPTGGRGTGMPCAA
jgi:hypothetical protein